jgi:hypothetical protein
MNDDAWKALCRFARHPHDDPREPWEVVTTKRKPTQTRRRKVTLARALRQADRAGVPICGATVKADGSVALELGSSSPRDEEFNEWDSVGQQ